MSGRLIVGGGLASAVMPLVIITTLLGSSGAATPPVLNVACAIVGQSTATGQPAAGEELTGPQVANAQLIVSVTKGLALPVQAAAIALMTAEQESGLLNLYHGDRDSLGLFQQRPSQGWGTPAEILDPTYATTAFLTRLSAVHGWASMPMADAAQLVQDSIDGSAYAEWASFGTALAAALWTGSTGQVVCTQPVDYSVPTGASPAAQEVLTFAQAQLGKPYVYGAEGPDAYDCSGLALRAYQAAGIGLPRISQDQWSAGPHVPADQLEPGDLVFFDPDPSDQGLPGHVGIYIGSGNMIDAPHTGSVVRVESVADFGNYMGAVRPMTGDSV